MENQDKAKEAEVVEKDKENLIKPLVVPEAEKAMLTEDYVKIAEKQIELRSKLLMTALKALKPHDFQDFDGKPYLEGEGAARIMAVIRGFRVGEAEFNVESIAPHYFIECGIPMEFMGATTVAIGDCSTADPFFTGRDGKSGQYKRHLDRTGNETMAARLILGDAKKKARENAISRGVSELLGIKGLTWDDLKKLGFDKSGAGGSVQFKQGANGAELKTLSVEEASLLKVGSVCNIRAFLTDIKSRTAGKNGSKITDYTVTDEKGKEMKVSSWGEAADNAVIGNEIYFGKVKVSEYQGRLGYLADEVSMVGTEQQTAEKQENGTAE